MMFINNRDDWEYAIFCAESIEEICDLLDCDEDWYAENKDLLTTDCPESDALYEEAWKRFRDRMRRIEMHHFSY